MTLRIANAAGFLGDNLDAPRLLVEAVEVQYLTLEYLAELTLSILARQREKDPKAGYAGDFLDALASLLPALHAQPDLRVVTNAGGMNPHGCARAAAAVLCEGGLEQTRIGVVGGDDIAGRLDEIQAAGCELANLETGQPLAELDEEIVSANVYLGAPPIAEALQLGARLVVTGRVADVSLTVAPAVHHYRWNWDDWNRLAAATVAGHLIECGAQVTGGYSTTWRGENLAEVGYPLAELAADGTTVITKPAATGGAVTRHSVVEQLVYEIGDPRHYLTPDVDVDFTSVDVAESGPDRVTVTGARGSPPPDSYKVSIAYRAGYTASGQMLVYGNDCVEKAKNCAQIVLSRVERAGFILARTNIEYLGAGDGVPGLSKSPEAAREVVLRMTVEDSRREAVERFTRELAPLATSGPAGLAGYTAARGKVRPVFAYWPALAPKGIVEARVKVGRAVDLVE